MQKRPVEDEADEIVEEPIHSGAPPVPTSTIAPPAPIFVMAPPTVSRVPVVTAGPDTVGQSTSRFIPPLGPTIRSVPATVATRQDTLLTQLLLLARQYPLW